MTKSQALQRIAAQDAATLAKVVDTHATSKPGYTDALDDHGTHMAVVRHLGMDFSLGSATIALAEARRLAGAARREKLARAMSYIAEEIEHIDRSGTSK